MLLHLIGEDALEVFNTFEFGSEEDKEKPVERNLMSIVTPNAI